MSTTATKPWGVRGLTESPRAPLVAKAKIGEKGDRGQPKRLDYIIFVEPQTGRRLPEYQAVFGEKPTSFKALLSADTIADMVDVAWKRYGKQGLKCRGDGDRGVERDTGEQRECAGDFGAEGQYRCAYANAQGTKPPECKPVLSMRLVVPQIPGLGVVQLDTGGVASSIPTLMWQLQLIERGTESHMAGIAVEMGIRAFTDRFGNAAYSWQITPLSPENAQELRQNIEGLVRIEGQVPKVLPALQEAPDADLYGLEPADESRQIEAAAEDDLPGVAGEEIHNELTERADALEAQLLELMEAANMPQAKRDATEAAMQERRPSGADGHWAVYLHWLERAIDKAKEQAR
jgi:hypothetical protein